MSIRDKSKISTAIVASAHNFNEYFFKAGHTVTSEFDKQEDIEWKNPIIIYSFEFVTTVERKVVTDLLTLNADSNNDVLQLDWK